MSPSTRRSTLVILLAMGSTAGVIACGASINAVYESDVRFEHCMALEELPEGRASTQKACWDEWVKYYTYGQTRDRVDYARMRQKQLSGESDFTDQAWTPPALAQRVVPEPTSVLAPPPMLIHDAGNGDDASADAAADADAAVPEPPAAACADTCRDAWTPCKEACANAACEKACERKYRTCMRKCF